ncbi:sunset domain-containing protein [Saccharothrix syringae]|uniref:Uncharacterized protein n=1 Tax=Saccharothrix syringae TaxID=103733 RepID=A0A5Q0GWR0_SACSY|nr:hypothetical protein [Saccharothrix syringae]QFZ18105.1 hypothetical protein EKG83_11990 [Saccharothrix syringae]
MFWLFTQIFVLCALAFAAGAMLTWLPLRAAIRDLRVRADLARAVTWPALPPAVPTALVVTDGEVVEPHAEVVDAAVLPVRVEEPVDGEGEDAEEASERRVAEGGAEGVAGVEAETAVGVGAEGAAGREAESAAGTGVEGRAVTRTKARTTSRTRTGAVNGERREAAGDQPVEVKCNSRSMVFHTPASPYFKRMKGDVTFNSAEEAERAGYTRWTPKARAGTRR